MIYKANLKHSKLFFHTLKLQLKNSVLQTEKNSMR